MSMSNLSTSLIISCSRFSNDFTLWNMKVRLSLRVFLKTVAFERLLRLKDWSSGDWCSGEN